MEIPDIQYTVYSVYNNEVYKIEYESDNGIITLERLKDIIHDADAPLRIFKSVISENSYTEVTEEILSDLYEKWSEDNDWTGTPLQFSLIKDFEELESERIYSIINVPSEYYKEQEEMRWDYYRSVL